MFSPKIELSTMSVSHSSGMGSDEIAVCFLAVLEKVDVLGHARVLPTPLFHGLLESHDVDIF